MSRQRRIHGGGRVGRSPLDWAKKNFIAQPKNTHICKPPFACQNVLKLAYSNIEFQNFLGEDPGPPTSRGGEGRGREGRDARHGLRPPRDKLWIRPCE